MRVRSFLPKLVVTFLCCLTQSKLLKLTCAVRYWEPFIYNGDVMLGVFVPIHSVWESSPSQEPEVTVLGFKFLEAILSTLDAINSRKNYLNYTLGAVVFDSFSNAEIALRQSLSFIGLNISRFCDPACGREALPPVEEKPITALIGPAYSDVSLSVASLLKLFSVPQVSYYSAAPKLSMLGRYPTFFRTIPSVRDAIKTIVHLLGVYHWNYVNLIVDNSDYGESNHGVLLELLRNSDQTLCIDKRIQLSDGHTDMWEMDQTMSELLNSSATVNLILCSAHLGDLAMKVVQKWPRDKRDRFLWIGTNTIEPDFSMVQPNRTVQKKGQRTSFKKINNVLLVLPRLQYSDELAEYSVSLNRSYGQNRWRDEYLMWECSCIPNGTVTTYKDPIGCTKEQEQQCISLLNGDAIFYLPNTVNAVLAIAESLKKIQDKCPRGGQCYPDGSVAFRTRVLAMLDTISFTGFGGEKFQFSMEGDGKPLFTVLAHTDGENLWQTLAECDASRKTPTCNATGVVEDLVTAKYPYSRCCNPCEVGSATTYDTQIPCCWKCTECSKDAIVQAVDKSTNNNVPNATVCVYCAPGTRPNQNQTKCDNLPADFMSIADPSAITMCALSVVAILLSSVMLAIYLHNWNTPVIRASGRETTLVLFTGIFCSYVTPIIVLSHEPTLYVCSWATIAPGLCSTISYAAIYVRISRIDRIFRLAANPVSSATRFVSPRSQILFMVLLICADVLVLAITMSLWPPTVTQILSGSNSYLGPRKWEQNGSVIILKGLDTNPVVCFSNLFIPQFCGMLIPIFLLLVSLLHAYKIRKVPCGYNEARQLGVVNYVNLLLFIITPILMLTFQLTSRELLPLSGLTFLMATNQLVVLIMPKLYIILFTPEKNTTGNVLQRDRSQTQIRGVHVINELDERWSEGLSTITSARCRHSLGGLHELSAANLVSSRLEGPKMELSRQRSISLVQTSTSGEATPCGRQHQKLRPRCVTTGHASASHSQHGCKAVSFHLNDDVSKADDDNDQHVPLLTESVSSERTEHHVPSEGIMLDSDEAASDHSFISNLSFEKPHFSPKSAS
ncbi:Metabotropic glutamate receptor 7 [Clonorchis sinensis]|uniref:Metabotropic X receptor n=2 Tax=Clonorchis sinensis TaxID=79923 RepID=G7YGV1_CLOSI|nr:Metabotropic glutamate receptor 7 [Clonorchis sinensis]GAA52184.1 metabotropic X receptor [Clonorchis sinensis]